MPFFVIIFGTTFVGSIKKLYGQAIKTRVFHILWIPVLPLGSMFVIDDEGDGVRGFKVRLRWISWLIAYPRRILALVWLSWPFIAIFEYKSFQGWEIALGSFVVWCLAMFLVGRNSKKERYERTLIGIGSGIFADPRWFKPKVAAEILEGLTETWKEAGHQDWRGAASSRDGGVEALPSLYAMAAYNAVANPGTEANILLKGIQQWAQQALPEEAILEWEPAEEGTDEADPDQTEAAHLADARPMKAPENRADSQFARGD